MVSVAVIIPCKNQGRFLYRAVTSALDADQIIIVDDHSTDHTARIAVELEQRHPQTVRALNNRGSGVVTARNTGITAADCDLVVPLDADDFFAPSGLATLINAWSPGVWIYTDYYLADGSGVTERKHAPPPGVLRYKNVCHATICFARTDWERVGGYDSDFELGCEDWAFCIALTQSGVAPLYIPDATYIRAPGERSRACLRHASTVRRLLADKYGRQYA